MSRSRFLLATAFCLVALLAPFVWAQENATITGTVLDPTGAAIPNVAITLTNPPQARLGKPHLTAEDI